MDSQKSQTQKDGPPKKPGGAGKQSVDKSGPPKKPAPLPPGFKAPREKSIAITFHVLLPKWAWEWNAKSEVYIRFGHDELGHWEYDSGPLSMQRLEACSLL